MTEESLLLSRKREELEKEIRQLIQNHENASFDALRRKKEAYYSTQIDLLVEEDLSVECQESFFLNPRFEGEEHVGVVPHADYFIKEAERLKRRLREKGVDKLKLKVLDISDLALLERDALRLVLSAVLDACDAETLVLKRNKLTDGDINYLNEAILGKRKAFSSLSELDVSENHLTAKCWRDIRQMVLDFELKTLNLSGNVRLGRQFVLREGKYFETIPESWNVFFEDMSRKMSSLQELQLRNVGFDLAPFGIKDEEYRTELDRFAKALSELFKKTPFLQRVDLRENPELVALENVLPIIQKGVRGSISLKELHLDATDNPIADDIQKELAERTKRFGALGGPPVLLSLLNTKELNPEFSFEAYFNDKKREDISKSILKRRRGQLSQSDPSITEQEVVSYFRWERSLVVSASDVFIDMSNLSLKVCTNPILPSTYRPFSCDSIFAGTEKKKPTKAADPSLSEAPEGLKPSSSRS